MSYSLSLQASVRSCQVNVGESNRIQSDRFFNPSNMVCIPWDGMNNKGQQVSPDSFYTKTPGCDSAEDRVMVENSQRPKYMNYVTLGADGIEGNIYGGVKEGYGNVEAAQHSVGRSSFDKSRNELTGNFGTDFGSKVAYQGCSIGAYERGMAQMAETQRGQEYYQNTYKSNQSRQIAGGY
jgi:hypothetical protein